MQAPLVSVIVTHHLDENRGYLDLCLRALAASEGVPFEAIVISDAPTCPDVPEGMTLVHNRDLDTATKKGHFGIAMAHPESKYFFFLSDDVVIARHTIARMVEATADQMAISIPMSNGDNGAQFSTVLELERADGERRFIPIHLELEDVAGWEEAIIDFPARPPLVVPVPYVCFFCTLIPRRVWDVVGPLDPRLENRHNDQDYCYRARRLGIPSLINFGTFALHFGSKTLDKVAPTELRDEATRVFMEKWGMSA